MVVPGSPQSIGCKRSVGAERFSNDEAPGLSYGVHRAEAVAFVTSWLSTGLMEPIASVYVSVVGD